MQFLIKILGTKRMKSIADAIIQCVSQDATNPIVLSVGCSQLETSEFIRAYLAAKKFKELFENDTWGEPRWISCNLYKELEAERVRRKLDMAVMK